MEQRIYRPDIYEGSDPYLFVSCHPQDRERVLGVLEKLDMRGFRFWMNDGIAPGMDADEIIAEHIEGCSFFVAFLSKAYLGFLDTLDELNYSRDVDKDYLLVWLDDTALPTGMDMRFQRAQSVPAFSLQEDEVYQALLNLPGAERFFGIADPALRPRAEKVFQELEQLYPEHRVFALDAVAKQLSKRISALYVTAGYPSVERLLLDYGFSIISTDEARSMRSSVLYQPGFEPETVKQRVDHIVRTLSEAYPDGVITDSLPKSHKAVYTSVQGLSVWLGYATASDMLHSYGFTGMLSEGGRRAADYDQVLNLLRERYASRPKPQSLIQLLEENRDLNGALKTLSNTARERLGQTLNRYLKSVGLIVPREPAPTAADRSRERILASLRECYASAPAEWGSFDEAEAALSELVLRRRGEGDITVRDCDSCEETLRIPAGVNIIGREAFFGQTDLVHLILPPTVRFVQAGAFAECTALETVTFSEGLESIAEEAFAGCESLQSVTLPASLRSVGGKAFSGCGQLAEVTLLNPRTSIQEDAFDGCIFDLSALSDAGASPAEFFELKVDRKNNAKILSYTGDEEIVVIPGMIAGHPILSVEKGAFKDNDTVREVLMHDSISGVNGDVFKNCVNLERVHLPEAVKSLTATVFSGCERLAEVNVPNCMTEVQRGLFKDAPLTRIYIGRDVQRISPDAFYKGTPDFATGLYLKTRVLEEIIVDGDNETFAAEGSMLLSRDRRVLYAELGDPVTAEIPEGVEEIGAQAFDRLSSLTEVRLPSTLRHIGEKAFAGTSLSRVELPAALEEIGVQAFSFCRSLREAELGDGLRVIGKQAFEGCPLEDVFIPASVELLGSDSFLAISAFQGQTPQRFRVDTANPNITADGVALYQKTANGVTLVKAYHPDLRPRPGEPAPEPVIYAVAPGTTEIGAQAFARCANLAGVTLPDGLQTIGDLAFMDCPGLTEIHIPESCAQISPKAFFGCNAARI